MRIYRLLFGALRDAVNEAWPDVREIYHASEIATENFEQIAANPATRLPVAVMDVGMDPSSEWGIVNDVDDGAVTLYRIAKSDYDLDAEVEMLEQMRDHLWNSGLSHGQVVELPALRFGLNVPLNLTFVNKRWPLWAGAVVARIVEGETP